MLRSDHIKHISVLFYFKKIPYRQSTSRGLHREVPLGSLQTPSGGPRDQGSRGAEDTLQEQSADTGVHHKLPETENAGSH